MADFHEHAEFIPENIPSFDFTCGSSRWLLGTVHGSPQITIKGRVFRRLGSEFLISSTPGPAAISMGIVPAINEMVAERANRQNL